MNLTKMNNKSLVFALVAAGVLPLSALAAPAVTSPYTTDPQNSYVQDATSDGISSLNMVLCIMDAMKPADMVNIGPYVALVDKNKCDSKSQSSASNSTGGASGATAAPDYMNAVVDVTRASNSDPMIGKIWMSMTEQGNPVDIYVHATAIQSPTDAPPYGQFRLDYIGKAMGSTMFNGFIDANGAAVSYLETGASSSQNSLAMTATSTTAASGIMNTVDQNTMNPVTFNFAYDSSETSFPAGVFRRNDGTNDVCFDRSKAAASKSVWRYGTYNANDGTRVDQTNPGFPVQASYNGSTYWGYASYWGVNFQGLDLNSFADGALSGVAITDQRPGNTSTYTLSKSSGKLTKWAQNHSTLAAMDGVPFMFWGDLTGKTNDSSLTTGNWQMQWDNANSQFTVIGTQTCGNNGCVLSTFQQTAAVTAGAFSNTPISGWSDAFGGNINIPYTGSQHGGSDAVDYYTQSDVVPGDGSAPTALYCLSNCPTAASLSAFTGSNSPFGNNTGSQWNTASSAANTVTYGFGSTGLTESSTVLKVSNANAFTGQYQFGVQSGRLFTTALSNANCPSGAPGGTVCEPANPGTYYTWQTGPNQWNQSLWLTKTSDSSVVQFDPPENVAYTVPSDTAYGSWAGKNIQLQFNGFGNLQGIPGGCVNPTDNSPTDCGTAGARYVPEFSIPDGATMTLTSSNTPLIVKALDSELRLAKVACGTTSLAQPSSTATLPSVSDVHDPSNPTDVDYLGTKPTVTDAPKVIHGVIQ